MVTKEPENWNNWVKKLSEKLHARSRWRLKMLLIGIIWSKGRKTVTAWLRGAGIEKGYQEYYYFLSALGKKAQEVAEALLMIVMSYIFAGVKRIVGVIDDSPTRRYGPKVEGAGIHHDGTKKPTDQTLLYGHIWVTLALLAKHIQFGNIALPMLSKLYIRSCDVAKLPADYGWQFKSKVQLASELVQWLHGFCQKLGISLWIVFDGWYTKKSFLKKRPYNVTFVGRLRRDAALYDLPEPRQVGQRGAPRKYGKNKISLAKRAGQKRGWYKSTVKGKSCEFKFFLATYRHVGGPILVVLRRYNKKSWAAFFCTYRFAAPLDVLEIVADRWGIEENFHDVKEYLGSGEQQVRNLWTNIACWHLGLWSYVLIYLWSWNLSSDQLVDRSFSPWDSQTRRPSINDRIRSLRRVFLGSEIIDSKPKKANMQKILSQARILYRAFC